MKKNNIEIVKTARYFTLGELNKNTKSIWFVFHGYAQTADDFLDSIKDIQTENSFIVSPEGLSRFYWKDFFSNPVASWMTKLDREDDIKDNNKYLQKLYYTITKEINLDLVQINFLGFSQGVATMSRLLNINDIMVNNVFFYAGEIAKDLNLQNSVHFMNSNIFYIYGNKDFFIGKNKIEILKNYFNSLNKNIEIYSFNGKHEIHIDALTFIRKNIF